MSPDGERESPNRSDARPRWRRVWIGLLILGCLALSVALYLARDGRVAQYLYSFD